LGLAAFFCFQATPAVNPSLPLSLFFSEKRISMTTKTQASTKLKALPLLPQEHLYVGVDVGKFRHVAGFLSRTLLMRHERFEGCPTWVFEQSREGFRSFVDRLGEYVPLEQVIVLMEHTGHYHRLLEQYLLDLDITVYRVHVQKRAEGMLKTDKRDALALANRLYTQLELGAQVQDKMQLVRRIVPPTSAAAQLQGIMRHRYELSHMSTQYRNKLTAICDQLFPELVQVFHDPNLPTALAFRAAFPTPHAIAIASLNDLRAVRQRTFPSDAQLLELQRLADRTIGVTDLDRQRGLVLEQGLLIKELQLIQEHLENLQTTITDIVQNCREGQILLSIPPIGPVLAATAIATIGNIANFEKACELKSYFGWAPRKRQTGVTMDQTSLSIRGVRPMKQLLFIAAAKAIILDCEWAKIYQRLLPRLCTYDEKAREYRGKKRVLARIAGQMTSMIYALLKTDQETLSQVPPGGLPPPPMLYDREIHRKHQEGSYRSLKPNTLPRKILRLPSKS
jgi:transposase